MPRGQSLKRTGLAVSGWKLRANRAIFHQRIATAGPIRRCGLRSRVAAPTVARFRLREPVQGRYPMLARLTG